MNRYTLILFIVFAKNIYGMWQEEGVGERTLASGHQGTLKKEMVPDRSDSDEEGLSAKRKKRSKKHAARQPVSFVSAGLSVQEILTKGAQREIFDESWLGRKEAEPVASRKKARHAEPACRNRKAYHEKHALLNKLICQKRLKEIEACTSATTPGEKDSESFLNYEKVFKLTLKAKYGDLPPLCEEEPEACSLAKRIETILKRPASEISVRDETAPEQRFFLTDFKRSSNIVHHANYTDITYKANQIGKRVDRFLTFFEKHLQQYDSGRMPQEEKGELRQKLNRLADLLASFESGCIDATISTVAEMEKTMLIFRTPLLMKPFEDLAEQDIQEKEERLMELALHDYKKFLLVGLASLADSIARSLDSKKVEEEREAYIRYLLMVQRTVGLGRQVRVFNYEDLFADDHQKTFSEIIQFMINEMSVAGFLHFMSATTTLPNELRQWSYQAFVGEKTNFDEHFFHKYALWQDNKTSLWQRVEEGEETDPFFVTFYRCDLQSAEDALTNAYGILFAQTVQDEVRQVMERLGYFKKDPFYKEPFSFDEKILRD
jgi:hypothetical protein